MMQELFYVSASSSLTIVKENGETAQWSDITNLVIASGSEQIIAYSGSNALVYFALENTNLYYNEPYPVPTSFYPYEAPSGSNELTPIPASLIIGIAPFEPLNTTVKNNAKLYLYSGSTYYVSQSGLNDSISAYAVDSGKSHTLVLSGSGAFFSYVRVNDVQTPSVSIIETSSFNSNIITQFTPEANKSYNVVYTMTDNVALSASVISWSFFTQESAPIMKSSSYCTIYDTFDSIYYVSHSGENAYGSFNAVAGRMLSASVFGTGSTYVTRITVYSSSGISPLYDVSSSSISTHLAFSASNAITYQVTMSVVYPET